MIALGVTDIILLGGLSLTQPIAVALHLPIPPHINPQALAEWLVLTNPGSEFLTEDGRNIPSIIRWLAAQTWPVLFAFTVPIALGVSRWAKLVSLVNKLFPLAPTFIRPLERPVPPDKILLGRQSELAELNAFLRSPAEKLVFGVCGSAKGGSHLVRYALRSLPRDWIVGTLTGPPIPQTHLEKPLAVIVDVKTATPEIWDAAAKLLDGPGRVRILIDGDVDFPELRIGNLDTADRLKRRLYPRIVARPLEVEMTQGVLRRVARGGPQPQRSPGSLGEGTYSGTGQQSVFITLGRLSDEDLLVIAQSWNHHLSLRFPQEKLEHMVRRAGGLPRLLLLALMGQLQSGETAEGTLAKNIIRRAISPTLFGSEGYRVVALAALAAAGPVPAEVRKKIAPNSGDRRMMRALFGAQSSIDDDRFVLPIQNDAVALEALLQALSHLQSPDRTEIFAEIDQADPDTIFFSSLRLIESRWTLEIVPHLILSGPENERTFLTDYPQSEIGSTAHQLVIIREIVTVAISSLRAPSSEFEFWRNYKRSALDVRLSSSAIEVAGRLGRGDRRYMLDILATLRPRDQLIFDTVRRSRLWRTHPSALKSLLEILFVDDRNDQPHRIVELASSVAPDDLARPALENLDVLNAAYAMVAETERDPKAVSTLAARADRTAARYNSNDPVEALTAAWAGYWLVSGHLTWTPLVSSSSVLSAAISTANLGTVHPLAWSYAAHTVAKIASGPIERRLISEWTDWVVDGGTRPSLPKRQQLVSRALIEPALRNAEKYLESEHPIVRRAAAMLRIVYFDDPCAAKILADSFIDPELDDSDRTLSFLYRLAQNGSKVAISAAANAFRNCFDMVREFDLFLFLLVIEDAASLSDQDLDPDGSDMQGMLSIRRAILKRNAQPNSAVPARG